MVLCYTLHTAACIATLVLTHSPAMCDNASYPLISPLWPHRMGPPAVYPICCGSLPMFGNWELNGSRWATRQWENCPPYRHRHPERSGSFSSPLSYSPAVPGPQVSLFLLPIPTVGATPTVAAEDSGTPSNPASREQAKPGGSCCWKCDS